MDGHVVTGNSDLIRQLNRSLVLDLIRHQGPISRADVKRITGLNFTTVTNAVGDLVEEGLVQEVGLGSSSGGRKPVLLTLNPTARYVIGCELQSTLLIVGLFDLTGTLLATVEEPKDPATSPADVVAATQRAIEKLLAEANVPKEKVQGLGVAAPGPLNSRTGVLLTPPNMLGWHNVPLREMLEQATGLPVTLEKDGNAAALGEAWFGAGQGARDLIFIIVDFGIGGGIITGGHLYRGRHGGAGEIGHTTIDVDGPRCSCGNYGCLEAIASGSALGRRAGEAIRRGVETFLARHGADESAIGVEDLLKAADAGDKLAADLLDECGRNLGIAVANIVNMYNPELIVLGGRLAQHSDTVLNRAQELGRNRAFSVLSQDARIVTSALGDQFLLAGAAALVLAGLFRGPVDLTPPEA
ncbi:MAG TPA: ROK family transcriptional regulator [Symbiobacteriaceae bacterium]|nr:ROK family transcriptional regulator [Symbiobacteriaceae bacterium]